MPGRDVGVYNILCDERKIRHDQAAEVAPGLVCRSRIPNMSAFDLQQGQVS
jgi:hypothetical protein